MKKNKTKWITLLLFISGGLLFLIIHPLNADDFNIDKTLKFKELNNDVWLSLRKNLSARIGFKELGTDSLNDPHNSMRSFSPFSALLNWHLFDNNFYLSMGAVQGEDSDLNPQSEFDTPRSLTLFSWSAQNENSEPLLNFDMNKNEPYLGFGFGNYLNKKANSFFFLDFGILYYSQINDQNSGNFSPSENRNFFEKMQSISFSDEENNNSSYYQPLFKMGLSLKY